MNISYGCVHLRAMEKRDMDLLRKLINDASMEMMTGGWCFPVSEESQLKWFENFDGQKELRYMIDIKDNQTIGTIGLTKIDWKNKNAELFAKLDNCSKTRIKGDMTDALMGIIQYAFEELNLKCIYGAALDYNIFSQKMVKKCGFKQEGVLRERIYKKGKYHNQYLYSILKEEFEAKKKEASINH